MLLIYGSIISCMQVIEKSAYTLARSSDNPPVSEERGKMSTQNLVAMLQASTTPQQPSSSREVKSNFMNKKGIFKTGKATTARTLFFFPEMAALQLTTGGAAVPTASKGGNLSEATHTKNFRKPFQDFKKKSWLKSGYLCD